MEKIEIAIHALAEFVEGTEATRKRIIKDQLKEGPLPYFYYNLARHRIKKAILKGGNLEGIEDAREILKGRKPKEKTPKFYDKRGSLEAFDNFESMKFPEAFELNEFELVKPQVKHLPYFDLLIKVSPDYIYRTEINGQKVIGAFKLHLSKDKKFTVKQSSLVAQLIQMYLSVMVAEEDEIVDPNLCLSIDLFSKTTIQASHQFKYDMKEAKRICSKVIPPLWDELRNSDVA